MPRLVVRARSVPELVSSQSTTTVVFQGGPLTSICCRRNGCPATAGRVAHTSASWRRACVGHRRVHAHRERVLEAPGKRCKYRLGIALVDGGKQCGNVATNDGVIHA